MNKTNENETPAPLIPCVSYLREIIRKEDRNGLCTFDDVKQWDTEELTETLRGCFESFVLEGERNFDKGCISRGLEPRSPSQVKALNLEDRWNAFAVLERAESFGSEVYASEFLRLAPYILRNVSNA
jgi:hypothetical protein